MPCDVEADELLDGKWSTREGIAPRTVMGALTTERGSERAGARATATDKYGPVRCRRFRVACWISLASCSGSIRQKDPLPGSSGDRGILMK